MAYSRWTNSRWYTYWSSASPSDHLNKKQWQKFVICDFYKDLEFTYKQLSLDIDKALNEACDYHSKSKTVKSVLADLADSDLEEKPLPVSQAERDELKGYMLQFLKDVDDEFEKKKKGKTHD